MNRFSLAEERRDWTELEALFGEIVAHFIASILRCHGRDDHADLGLFFAGTLHILRDHQPTFEKYGPIKTHRIHPLFNGVWRQDGTRQAESPHSNQAEAGGGMRAAKAKAGVVFRL